MNSGKKIDVVSKKVGGYLITIAAACGGAYLIGSDHILLGTLAFAGSFSANYYTEFVLPRYPRTATAR